VARYDRTIPPGGEGDITLKVHTKNYQGNLHKSARVSTNDPKTPTLTIGLKGKIWAPIFVKPQYARLFGISGEDVETTIHIHANKKEPLKLELASVSVPDKVETRLETLEENKIYGLKIRNKVDGEARYNGHIKLTTNYPEKPELVVRISANVRPAVELRPKALSFGRIPEDRLQELSEQGRALKRPIMVVLNKGQNLEIKKVEWEKSLFKAVPKEMSQGKMTQLLIEPIFEKLEKGANEDHIRIYTNQKGNEVLEATVRFEVL
jgi:hypothetical protein